MDIRIFFPLYEISALHKNSQFQYCKRNAFLKLIFNLEFSHKITKSENFQNSAMRVGPQLGLRPQMLRNFGMRFIRD